jgi:hypothetical protein
VTNEQAREAHAHRTEFGHLAVDLYLGRRARNAARLTTPAAKEKVRKARKRRQAWEPIAREYRRKHPNSSNIEAAGHVLSKLKGSELRVGPDSDGKRMTRGYLAKLIGKLK